jgi:hypothetical protein
VFSTVLLTATQEQQLLLLDCGDWLPLMAGMPCKCSQRRPCNCCLSCCVLVGSVLPATEHAAAVGCDERSQHAAAAQVQLPLARIAHSKSDACNVKEPKCNHRSDGKCRGRRGQDGLAELVFKGTMMFL